MALWQRAVHVFILLLCTGLTTSFGARRTPRERTITVKKGRVAALHPRELNLSAFSQDLCKVEVVLNDPMTQRVGKVTPKVFDCEFQPYSVKYIHNGNPLLKSDVIKLNVHRFTQTDSLTTQITVTVNIIDTPYEIFVEDSRLGHLQVKEFFGISNEIDSSVLRFRYNYYSGATCSVHYSQPEYHLPMLGQIVAGSKGKSINTLTHDCRDLLYMGLKYKHMSPPTPDVDYLPLSVEVDDPVLSDEPILEHMYLPIHISGAFPNTPPEASFMSSYVLEVDQFVLTPIDPDIMSAKDAETPLEQIVFNITKPPGNREGYFVHLSDHTKPISSFLQADLMNNDIAYQPPDFPHKEKKVVNVEFVAYDSHFAPSQPIMLDIAIRPTSSPSPFVVVNTGLMLVEGQSRPILPGNLHIVDSDNPEDLKIFVKGGLKHGRLVVNGRPGFIFTPSDLEAGHVTYYHDDSDALEDKILLRVHDGSHTIRTKFPITILPKDDSAPYLINNLGLEVREGGSVQITMDHLSAHDKDSDDTRIIYMIKKPPQAGEIVKKYRPLTVGQKVAKFSQLELSRGLIYYHHLGGEIHEDSFDFRLMDENEPPNKSGKYNVNVLIQPVSDKPPHQVKGSSRQLMVEETKAAYITQDMLHYEDEETPEEDLIYTITNQPFFLTTTITIDAGKLVSASNLTFLEKSPHAPAIHSFHQSDIDYQQIAYMPPAEDVGPIRRHARFTYTVSDNEGNELLEQYFDITILPVNNQVPHMSVQRLKVSEGGAVLVSPSDISAYDPDTDQDMLVFILTVVPRVGQLLRDEIAMVTGEQFKLSDLTTSSIRYLHDGSEVTEDSFTLQVSDGVNTITKVMYIGVEMVNDQQPQVVHGLTNVIQVEEGGEMAITLNNLAAKDSDTNDSDLNFVIVNSPQYGHIEVLKQKVEQFSQDNVKKGLVHYVHTGGETGIDVIYDSATFAISDGGDTHLSNRPLIDLNITILPHDNVSPYVILGGPLFVNEGETVPITFEVLSAHDVDTPLEFLIFEVSKQPDWGYILVNRPEPGSEIVRDEPATSFRVIDVKQGNVLYVQSNHMEVEPVADAFEVYVSDGNSHSKPFTIQINIVPRNDESPDFHVGDVTVIEGSQIVLNPTVFRATDADLPAEKLVVSVTEGPSHGSLGLLMQSATQGVMVEIPMHDITMEDLERDVQLFYRHDGSDSHSDVFSLTVTDGQHAVSKTSHVHIVPMNDERPQVLKNAGLKVNSGEASILNNLVLQTADADDPDDKIFFMIIKTPFLGVLQLRRFEVFTEEDYESIEGTWQDLDTGMNFTQEDVNMNQVRYVHTSSAPSTIDTFVFKVSDGENETPKLTFEIEILVRHQDSSGGLSLVTQVMEVKEGDSKVITTDLLSSTDHNNKNQDIVYHIMKPPSQGHLAFITEKNKPISSFTQMDLAAQKIVYIHSDKADISHDMFYFSVSNSANITRFKTFDIKIETIDQALPSLDANVPLTVVQSNVAALTSYNLHISDPDTSPLNLTYVITDPPQHGALMNRGNKVTKTFTQYDIDNKLIMYHSNGSDDSGIDFFLFTINDGHHDGYLINGSAENKPSFFSILIQPLSKEPPRLQIKRKPDLLEDLGEGKYGFLLTRNHLRATHPSCGPADLLFTVLEKPVHGYLENMATHKLIKKRFSQQDLDQGKVAYILSDGSQFTNDTFTFRVQDAFRNTLDNQKFILEWSVIEITQPHYIVCEDAGVLPITITRSGSLQGSSFVDIRAKEMSASQGIDYKPSRLSQLQFDPGETSVTWEIEIINDRLEENNEKMRVLLKNPINAVLGGYDKSSVQIINFKNGHCAEYIGMISRDQPTAADSLPHGYVKSKDAELFSYHGISPIQKSDTETYGDLEAVSASDLEEERKHKAQKEKKRRRKKKGKKKKGKRDRKHANRATTVQPDTEPPTVAADSAMSAAPHPCTKDTKGLLYFDLRSSRMYRCNGLAWEQWIQSQASSNMFKTAPTSFKETKKDCPIGWTRFRDDCFKSVAGKVTWSIGERRCREEYDSHLAHVESHKHLDWLWKLADNQPFWIGLNDRRSHHVWEYVHGGQVQFYHWRKGFPRSQRALAKNCVLVSHRAEWVNRPCDRNLARFICTKPVRGMEQNQYKNKGKRRRRDW